MAITMTRAEYEQKYGVKPVFQNTQTSSIDTTPAPVRMTREEYEQMYFPKQKSGLRKTLDTIQGEVASAQTEGVGKIKRGVDMIQKPKNVKEVARGGLRVASGVIDTAFAPLAPVFGRAMGVLSNRIEKASNDPNLQKFAMSKAGEKTTTTLEDVVDLSNVVGLYSGAKTAPKIASNVGKFTQDATGSISTGLKNRATNKLANEILNIENSYNKTAIKNTLSKDTGNTSRQRIANTDVLSNIVDEDGKITFESAKNAAKAYEQQTIAGAEGVVRDILKNENKTINLEEVRNILKQEIATSGLEGADLITAINGIKKEIAGLAVRADEFGNLPLYKIHDSKISTTKNIDYTKPPEVSYRRSLAKAYKNIVEQKSTATVEVFGKKYKIPEINQKLSEYYGDIERIESLGGKRVKGGKLGKYSAQIAGNLAGAAAGGAFGGPIGMAIGTVVGGEVASRLKGKQMANTFGKPRGRVAPKSDLLESAKLKAQEGQITDLRIPDKKVGASPKIPKTKEIVKIEGQIAKNVADQKKAIKAGDFTLVKALKEIYVALVEKLKEYIKLAKETSNKGFIDFGEMANSLSGRSSKPAKSPETKTVKSTPSKNSTTKAKDTQVDDLMKEARKYKSAEEFVKAFTQDIKRGQYWHITEDPNFKIDLSKGPRDMSSISGGGIDAGKLMVTSDLPYWAENYKGSRKYVAKIDMSNVPNSDFWQTERGMGNEFFVNLPEKARVEKVILLEQGLKESVKFKKWLEKNITNKSQLEEIWKKANQVEKPAIPTYKGEKDLTTKILKDLEGKTTVSKQYILDATNRGELKQVERDLIRQVVDTMPEGQINVADFAKKVKAELLPLKVLDSKSKVGYGTRGTRYENISLPDEIKGNVKNYDERVYQSPIQTSAGQVHFGDSTKNYFGHTRIEDMADNKTRRVIEVQSDLYQKGRLEGEEGFKAIELGKQLTREDKEILTKVAREAKTMREFFDNVPGDSFTGLRKLPQVSDEALYNFAKEGFPEKASIQKLQQYNDPTAHFRMIREEIKKAAQDGKTKLQFPTGETAMKIEGLGDRTMWYENIARDGDYNIDLTRSKLLTNDSLKVGKEINQSGNSAWIITDVLGDGKFKAVPKDFADKIKEFDQASRMRIERGIDTPEASARLREQLAPREETFDISGKVDTNNPIYKFYEKDVQKYLNKFGGKKVVDDKGVEWIEVPIKKEWAKMPVEAFAIIGAVGLASQE